MTIALTDRDLDLLETLTLRVRMLTLKQAGQLGWSDNRNLKPVRRRLLQMSKGGLIELHVINAHPELPVKRPLAAWRPGDEEPDAGLLSRSARTRWSVAARPTEVCVAGPLAACLFGSSARGLPAVEHRDHDLRLAAVYVHYRKCQPESASLWVGEHALPKAGYRIKDPDAFLRDSHGGVLRVIESAGHYSRGQFASFHQHCFEHDLPYELW